jgi:hypothetical protein
MTDNERAHPISGAASHANTACGRIGLAIYELEKLGGHHDLVHQLREGYDKVSRAYTAMVEIESPGFGERLAAALRGEVDGGR